MRVGKSAARILKTAATVAAAIVSLALVLTLLMLIGPVREMLLDKAI